MLTVAFFGAVDMMVGELSFFFDWARWQNGHAADCKSAELGSIPGRASNYLRLIGSIHSYAICYGFVYVAFDPYHSMRFYIQQQEFLEGDLQHYITINAAEQPIRLMGWALRKNALNAAQAQVCFEASTHQLECFLPTLMENLQRSAFKTIAHCDAVFWAQGPGSFMALRAVAAFLKTLLFCSQTPVMGFSRFEVWQAFSRHRAANSVLVALYAGRTHLYAAHYQVAAEAGWEACLSPQRIGLEQFKQYVHLLPHRSSLLYVGSGFERYPCLAEYYQAQPVEMRGLRNDPDPFLLQLGLDRIRTGLLDSYSFDAVAPEYLVDQSHWQIPKKIDLNRKS